MNSIYSVKGILRKPNIDNFDFYIILIDESQIEYITKIVPEQKEDIARGLVFVNETVIISEIRESAVKINIYPNNVTKRNSINGSKIDCYNLDVLDTKNDNSEENSNIQSLKDNKFKHNLDKSDLNEGSENYVSDSKHIIDPDDCKYLDNANDGKMQNLEEGDTELDDPLQLYSECDKLSFYPFLTDMPTIDDTINILPYKGVNSLSVAEIGNRTLPVHGLVFYKSRILTCKNNYPFFFFIVLKSGYRTLNAFFWDKKVAYYNSINIKDILVLKNYKRKKKLTGVFNFINSFSEIFLLNGSCVDITEKSEVYRDSEIRKCNNIIDSKYFKAPYNNIQGKIELMSIIMRKRHKKETYTNIYDKIIDFYYMLVDGKIVVLFNNSQHIFNELRSGCNIEINNTWKVNRGKVDYFTSSLFTLIKITSTDEKMIDDVLCFLPDEYNTVNEIFDPAANQIYESENNIISNNLIEYCSITELKELAEKLVIHEHRKSIVKGKLIGYKLDAIFPEECDLSNRSIMAADDHNLIVSMSYSNKNVEESFQAGFIKVKDCDNTIDLLVFKNLLVHEDEISILNRVFSVSELDQLKYCLENEYAYMVDLIRNDYDSVLIYVTKCFTVS